MEFQDRILQQVRFEEGYKRFSVLNALCQPCSPAPCSNEHGRQQGGSHAEEDFLCDGFHSFGVARRCYDCSSTVPTVGSPNPVASPLVTINSRLLLMVFSPSPRSASALMVTAVTSEPSSAPGRAPFTSALNGLVGSSGFGSTVAVSLPTVIFTEPSCTFAGKPFLSVGFGKVILNCSVSFICIAEMSPVRMNPVSVSTSNGVKSSGLGCD